MKLLAIAVLGLASAASAEEPGLWKDTAELSFVSTAGNTESTTFGVKNDFACAWEKTGVELGASALLVRSSGKRTAEQYGVREKLQRTVLGEGYAFQRLDWERDRFSGIESRWSLNGGFGAPLLKTDRDRLDLEGGFGRVWEERIGTDLRFATARLYVKYERKLGESSTFTQDAAFLESLQDADNFRVTAETAVTAPVSGRVSLKAAFRWKRVNRPPAGFKKDDTLTSAALLFSF